jgi:FixJ family two-component response regulator
VVVTVCGDDYNANILIKDTGRGIPPEVMPKLMQMGESFGKINGSGLGLYHAKQSIESWDGRISINSNKNGTEVSISLPRASSPGWFVPVLLLEPDSVIVVLDDDSSIHKIWHDKFDSEKLSDYGVVVHHFSTTNDVVRWYRESCTSNERITFLCDYELIGDDLNGLELVKKLSIEKNSILVTSRFEEHDVMDECSRMGVRMIPKGMAGFVPIAFSVKSVKPDAVLIDDDSLIHSIWSFSAKKNGKVVELYFDSETFLAQSKNLDHNIPIYIDSSLGKGVKGENVAKELYQMGFQEIYLSTGYDPKSFPEMSWIKGVVGKDPIWG